MTSLPRGVQVQNTTTAGVQATNEHLQHLRRCKVHPLYRGPVHGSEVIYVPCGHCGTPVDPVVRVPVGRMFFHPHCLRCAICGKIGSRTLPFAARQGQPVCGTCDRNKSVSLPPLKAAAFAERAKASINGVGTLRAIMERSATRSPTRRGHAMEMQQLSIQQRDPNILLISAERVHELEGSIAHARQQMQLRAQSQASSAWSNSLVQNNRNYGSVTNRTPVQALPMPSIPATGATLQLTSAGGTT